MPADRMFLLQYGAEPSPKWISVRGGGPQVLWMPVIGVVVHTDAGWVLLETGMSRMFLDDEAVRTGVYTSEEQPWMDGDDPLAHALEGVGLTPADLALAAVSHLHVDHAGGLRSLAAAGVPVAVQRAELAFARERATLADAYFAPDYDDPAIAWRELDGEAELAPGLHAFPTRGHTPGHMSYRVELEQTGTWIFAVDAADLTENLISGIPGGWSADPADGPHLQESLDRLLADAGRLGARLLPGHDTFAWAAARHPPGGWR
jgi:glyoxylase-like metal-dependent hydrolase (beta-lactamase superfamily II)